jgi:hypothetical protein
MQCRENSGKLSECLIVTWRLLLKWTKVQRDSCMLTKVQLWCGPKISSDCQYSHHPAAPHTRQQRLGPALDSMPQTPAHKFGRSYRWCHAAKNKHKHNKYARHMSSAHAQQAHKFGRSYSSAWGIIPLHETVAWTARWAKWLSSMQ